MVNLIANVVGALGAIVFVGFFAYKVDRIPLTLIVAFCLAFMIYSFYDDMRNDRTLAQLRRRNGAN